MCDPQSGREDNKDAGKLAQIQTGWVKHKNGKVVTYWEHAETGVVITIEWSTPTKLYHDPNDHYYAVRVWLNGTTGDGRRLNYYHLDTRTDAENVAKEFMADHGDGQLTSDELTDWINEVDY